ncbi:MAG: 4Fe-4S binding protein [Synergistales bacterium]|nr:4Fe-4S binding protein [Synergistales bacterium]
MRTSAIRHSVLFGFLAFLTWVGYRHQLLGGGREGAPTVDSLCPFGGLESLYSILTTGEWLRRVAPSAMILLLGIVIMTLLVGRVFCGWICPLGVLGEWTARLGDRLGIRKRVPPPKIDRAGRALKYGIMAAIILWTWQAGTLVWRDFDPWVAYMHLSAGLAEVAERPWAYVILFTAAIGASLFVERFWCRYLCPLGAALGILQRFSLVKVRRTGSTCVHCHLCGTACPMGLDPEQKDIETSPDCIACGRCVEACPVEKTLRFGAGTRRFSALSVGLVGLLLFFGTYGAAKVSGMWQTYSSISFSDTSTINPAEGVYGWMSVEQIASTVHLPEEKVIAVMQLPAGIPRDTSLKEVEGVDDEAAREHLEAYFADQGSGGSPPEIPNPDQIRGSMTALEVAGAFGLAPEAIFAEAGWPADAPHDQPLKELAAEYDRDVSEIRDAVGKLVE